MLRMKTSLPLLLALIIPSVVLAAVPLDPHTSSLGASAWAESADNPEALNIDQPEISSDTPVVDLSLEPSIPSDVTGLDIFDFDSGTEVNNVGEGSFGGDWPESRDNGSVGFEINDRDRGPYRPQSGRKPTGSGQPKNPVNPVPEPATVMLLAGGAAAAVWSSRQRRVVASESNDR